MGQLANRTQLTESELEVIKLIAQGLENTEIAQKLGMDVRGLNAFLTRIRDYIEDTSRERPGTRMLVRWCVLHELQAEYPDKEVENVEW